MKRFITALSALVIVGACGQEPASRTMSCQPRITAAHLDSTEAMDVDVFWDVSKTMQAFVGGTTHAPRAMNILVETLDNAILPIAGARGVSHIAVGNTVADARNAARALRPDNDWTDLHDAATRAGADLAGGKVGAVIFVSDMKLEIPGEQIRTGASICGGIRTPSTPRAGALFGPCMAAGFGNAARFENIHSTAFRTCNGDACLYVVLLATNVKLGREIATRMRTVWEPRLPELKEFTIADTLASQQEVARSAQCTWDATGSANVRRSETAQGSECRLRCGEGDPVRLRCTTPPGTQQGWLGVTLGDRHTLPRAREFTRTVNLRSDGFDLSILCPQAPQWLSTGTAVTYDWKVEVPLEASTDPDVRRLFESLLTALQERVPKRQTEIALDIR